MKGMKNNMGKVKNVLVEALRNDDKNSGELFQANGTFNAYKTGFPVLDYYLGTKINVFNSDGQLESNYNSLGITAGSINTIIGKTHTGKTSFAIQLASNIVRPFPNGTVIHCDLEGGTNYTRVGVLSKYTPDEMKDGKYILRQMKCSIEEIKMMISKIYLKKMNNKSTFQYDTGKVNEFGDKIISFEPTCIIIDSVARLSSYINENTKDGLKSLEEVSTQTDQMRLTAEVGRFLKESIEMLKAANIILFLINHIKEKPPMGTPQAPELRYLKQNETLPAGKALQYYTNTMIRLTSIGAEKYEKSADGFDGFGATAQFVKNRSNIDGTIVPLVFDKVKGYDSLRSSISFAKNNELIGGNKNGYYFITNKEEKFTGVDIHKCFAENRNLYKIMYNNILPILETVLSSVEPDEIKVIDEEMDY
jgi:RecA/RadA recombinase